MTSPKQSSTLRQIELKALKIGLQEIRQIQEEWIEQQEEVLRKIEELHVLIDGEIKELKSDTKLPTATKTETPPQEDVS